MLPAVLPLGVPAVLSIVKIALEAIGVVVVSGGEVIAGPLGGVPPEHDIFIQQLKLKNTLRSWMGEDPITHAEGE